MAKLQTVWEKYPDMRLGQLIMAVVQAKDPAADLFNIEDDRLLELLEVFGGYGGEYEVMTPTLEDMLSNITQVNREKFCNEIDFGPPVGKEVLDETWNFVFERAVEVFKSRKKALLWFKTPCTALGSQAPGHLLNTPEGIELILDTLGRIEHGVFA